MSDHKSRTLKPICIKFVLGNSIKPQEYYVKIKLLSPENTLRFILCSGGNGKYDNVEELGPDFSKLSKELNRVVLKIQHQAEVSPDCPMHNHDTSDSRKTILET